MKRVIIYCLCIFCVSCSKTKIHDTNFSKSEQENIISQNENINKVILTKKELEIEFKYQLEQWNQYRNKPEVLISAYSDTMFDCPAYRNIIELGKPVLPIIINEMKKGNHCLVYAFEDISGVDYFQIENEIDLDQLRNDGWDGNINELYIEWWNKKGKQNFKI